MSISGPTNPSTAPGLLTEDEFYTRHLDTQDGLETYRNEQTKEVQTEINEDHSFSAFKDYKDYVAWYGTRWSLVPINTDRFNSPDRYTSAIRASTAKSSTTDATSSQPLNQLKGFLGGPILTGIRTIEETFLSDVTVGNNTVSGMSLQMLEVFVAAMATKGLSGAYEAIEKLINTYANPLQGSTKQQVSAVVHTFDACFQKILGQNYYGDDSMWLQLRTDAAQKNPDFAIEVQEFVDGFVGDDDGNVHGFLNTAMNAPVFSELTEQTTELVSNMREQFKIVAGLHDIKSAGKVIEAIAGSNQKTRDLLYSKLGVTAKQVDNAAAGFSMTPGDPDSHKPPQIIEPNKPGDISEPTWLIIKDLAKSKFLANKNAFWKQIALMPIAFGLGMAAGAINPLLGIAVGAGIAGFFGGMDYSASKAALERATAYNAATHVTGVPLENDEHVAILDEDLNASAAAGLIGVASCFLIPPGTEGFFAAGMAGAVGSFTQWVGDSRQNSADHLARTQKYQFYNPETGSYDMTAEQAAQIDAEVPMQVLKGMAYTVTLGAVMGVAGETMGKGLEAILRVDAAPSADGLTHGTLTLPDGKETPVTMKPGNTPDAVVLQKPDGTHVTAVQNQNKAPVAILGDALQDVTPLHANTAPKSRVTPDPANNNQGFREISFSDLPPERQTQLHKMDETYQRTGDEESLVVMPDGNELQVPGKGDRALSTAYDSNSEAGVQRGRIAAHTQRDTIVPSQEDCRVFLAQAKDHPGEEFVTYITAQSKTSGSDPELLEVRIKYNSATDSFNVQTKATKGSVKELDQVDLAFEKAQEDFAKLTPHEQEAARAEMAAMPSGNAHSTTFNEALKAIQDTEFDLEGIPKLTSTSGDFAALTSVERYELFCLGLDNPNISPNTMSKTAWKYAFTPEQSYEAALKLAQKPGNGLMDLVDGVPYLTNKDRGFGILDSAQQIEILKLCVEIDPAAVKKNLGNIKSSSTRETIEEILYNDEAKAAKGTEAAVIKNFPAPDDQPIEIVTTKQGKEAPQKFSSREQLLKHLSENNFELNGKLNELFPANSVEDRVAIAKEAFETNPKWAIDHIKNFQLPDKELLPFASGLVETDPHLALDLLKNHGGIENPTDDYVELAGKLLNKLGIEKLPQILRQIRVPPSSIKWSPIVQKYAAQHPLDALEHISDFHAPGYYNSELTSRTLETIAKTNPIEVSQQIRDTNFNLNPEQRKRVAMAAIEANPDAVHYLDNYQLPPQMADEVKMLVPESKNQIATQKSAVATNVSPDSLASVWHSQDESYRSMLPQDRLGWLEYVSMDNILVQTKYDHTEPTPEQIEFWGGKDALDEILAAYDKGDINKPMARIERLKLEAQREIYFAAQGIQSHLQTPTFVDPTRHVMTYYSVGPRPAAITASLPEAIYFGATVAGGRGPETDVWAIDVPVTREREVIDPQECNQRILTDEGNTPEAYGLRHIGVLRDGKLIFDEGADIILYGDIAMGDKGMPNTDQYKTMQKTAAHTGELPPTMRREVRIPAGTQWQYVADPARPTDLQAFDRYTLDSFIDFTRHYQTG